MQEKVDQMYSFFSKQSKSQYPAATVTHTNTILLSGEHGDSLVRDNRNAYLSLLATRRSQRTNQEATNSAEERRSQDTNRRLAALELQQAALGQLINKLLVSLHTILPQHMEKVRDNWQLQYKKHIHTRCM